MLNKDYETLFLKAKKLQRCDESPGSKFTKLLKQLRKISRNFNLKILRLLRLKVVFKVDLIKNDVYYCNNYKVPILFSMDYG